MSLIETAVTVGAVAALLGMLLPALSESGRQSKEVHCLQNLGRIAAAGLAYAAGDREENAIPFHPLIGEEARAVGEYEWGGRSGRGEPLAGSGSDPIESRWGTKYGRGPASRRLNQVIFGDVFPEYRDEPGPGETDHGAANWLNDARLELEVFHCPADYGYTGHHYKLWKESGLTSYDHYGNSYTANTLWAGVPGSGCKLLSVSPFLRPVSRIPAPARTVLYMENCGRFAWRINYGGPGGGGCSSLSGVLGANIEVGIGGWHGRMFTFNVAFSDGHAARTFMFGHRQPQPDIGRYPDFEGLVSHYQSWHCVIIRGPDWQMDTLPAPAVKTSIPCLIGVPVQPVQ